MWKRVVPAQLNAPNDASQLHIQGQSETAPGRRLAGEQASFALNAAFGVDANCGAMRAAGAERKKNAGPLWLAEGTTQKSPAIGLGTSLRVTHEAFVSSVSRQPKFRIQVLISIFPGLYSGFA
jgi:hypothetical protein